MGRKRQKKNGKYKNENFAKISFLPSGMPYY
jgi:hypothetical protein